LTRELSIDPCTRHVIAFQYRPNGYCDCFIKVGLSCFRATQLGSAIFGYRSSSFSASYV